MPEPSVRDLHRADVAAVARIRVAGWRAAYAGILDDADLARLDPVAEAATRLAGWETRLPCRVAEVPGPGGAPTVAGFAVSCPYRADPGEAGVTPAAAGVPGDGELAALYVDPAAWSGGLGSALLGDAVARLAAAGHPVVRLWVLAGNDRARRFYARHGFVDEGVTAPFTPRGGTRAVPEVRYARRLAP